MPRHRLYQAVADRAHHRCEYCLTPEQFSSSEFEVDHIVPGAGDDLLNLALACRGCNGHKLTATQARDPLTGETIPLFNPRTQPWREHFSYEIADDGAAIHGLSPTGRVTARRLGFNRPRAKLARLLWIYALRSYQRDQS